jgi:uncharacterized protein YndB with AHSA1/START domain
MSLAVSGAAAFIAASVYVLAMGADDVTRGAEAIHQEISIAAPPAQVYAALTDATQFTKLTTFGMVKNAPPAKIGRAPGEPFSLFGGQIVGRIVELVPNRLIVQAWRDIGWPQGIYSLARFELKDEGSGRTTIVFDHTGFPAGRGQHLAEGWHTNYWEPMKALLERR